MRSPDSFYPVKLVSRSAVKKRTQKLRVAWFFVGAAFGVGCAFSLVPTGNVTAPQIAQAPAEHPAPPLEEAAQEVALINEEGAIISENAAPAASASARIYPLNLDLRVENGDTLITLLTDAGVPPDEAYNVIQALGKNFDPKRLDIGKNVTVMLDKSTDGDHPVIARMVLPVSLISSIEVTRAAGSDFSVKKVDAPVERKLARAGGRITSSLYETGTDAGIPASLLSEIINAYSYDVDFQRDIKHGDAVDVLYERMETKDGSIAANGSVIFAELALGGKPLKIYRFTDKSGSADYYNEKGESVRKALLRTPINGAKITSRFGMRNHPILGYTKMHRGVDFGAPTGTPIYAAGDGTVDFLGKRGGYGNYLRIKHNDKYASAYAHISRFASGLAPGRKVKQGQIIAYVGATGAATGPHLHYEILVSGAQVNPNSVKFKTGAVLKGTELANFRKNIEKIEATLAVTPRGATTLAMAESGSARAN
jgi:murein DD-endopeptidase MepM/ murein hydrolase activator NlpD